MPGQSYKKLYFIRMVNFWSKRHYNGREEITNFEFSEPAQTGRIYPDPVLRSSDMQESVPSEFFNVTKLFYYIPILTTVQVMFSVGSCLSFTLMPYSLLAVGNETCKQFCEFRRLPPLSLRILAPSSAQKQAEWRRATKLENCLSEKYTVRNPRRFGQEIPAFYGVT